MGGVETVRRTTCDASAPRSAEDRQSRTYAAFRGCAGEGGSESGDRRFLLDRGFGKACARLANRSVSWNQPVPKQVVASSEAVPNLKVSSWGDEAYAYCPRCRHQQPFVQARFDWRLHGIMTVLTLGIWSIVALSSAAKRMLWPWACEHCGWHEPDFRSPEERQAGQSKPSARSGQRGKWQVDAGASDSRSATSGSSANRRKPCNGSSGGAAFVFGSSSAGDAQDGQCLHHGLGHKPAEFHILRHLRSVSGALGAVRVIAPRAEPVECGDGVPDEIAVAQSSALFDAGRIPNLRADFCQIFASASVFALRGQGRLSPWISTSICAGN